MFITQILKFLVKIATDTYQFAVFLKNFSQYKREFKKFTGQAKFSEFQNDFQIERNHPILMDKEMAAGDVSDHYFLQDLLVARKIFKANPRRHLDVGSRVDGFISHVASFRIIEVMDIRPLMEVPGIVFHQDDLLDPQLKHTNQFDSISCLHALEHIGLGRYGDEVNFDGWFMALQNLEKMLKNQGILYLSLPSGINQRIEFNAHRVFSVSFLKTILMSRFKIESLDFIDDKNLLHLNVDLNSQKVLNSFDANYGCSIWTLRKST